MTPKSYYSKFASVIFVILLYRAVSVLADYDMNNDTLGPFDYYSMPVLAEGDDFDLCLRRPDAVYCILDLKLLEDGTPLSQYIKNFSSVSNKHYNYARLHRGVCGSQHCGLNLAHADASDVTAAILKDCINTSIHQKYGLQVDSLSVRYCKTKNDYVPPDTLDYIIGVLLLLLLLINLVCSVHYFFRPPENGKGSMYYSAFCVQINWKALKNGGNTEGEIFKCFQAIRFYAMVAIIGVHTFYFIGYGFAENSEFVENIYDDFFKSALINLRIVLQIFFVMGGFLMAYKMLVAAETHKFTWNAIPIAIVNRWFRIMPTTLVMMGLTMTWIPHLGSGPMWDALVIQERDICRSNWWQLIILMPNLFPFEHLCLPQTWYLGADIQLFFVSWIILLIVWKWPRSEVPVLFSVMVISLLISFLQSYFMNLLPIRVSFTPESIRNLFGNNDTFYYSHISAQGNWVGYHLGVLTAWFYHKAQTKKWDLGEFWLFKIVFTVSIPVALGSVFIGWDLHHREASAFESAVFNSLNQNIFALAICIFIIGCFYRCNQLFVGFLEWGPLQPLGSLSYCAMLMHTTVMRTYGGQMRRTIYITDYNALMTFVSIVVTTYLLSLPLHLFVEAPVSRVLKILFGSRRQKKE